MSRPQLSIEDRAKAYLSKLDNAVSGQHGHDKFFRAACVLVIDFDLSIEQARPVLQWFNENKCIPPFDQKQIDHKLRQASKQPGERGSLLRDTPMPKRSGPAPVHAVGKPESANESPALALGEYVEEMISGKRASVSWPWPLLTRLSRSLLPGTITVLSARQGTSKSLFVLEAAQHWVSSGFSTAVLELEEDRNYHLLRALAHLAGESNVTNDDWVRANPDRVRELWTKYSSELDALGKAIHEGPTTINTEAVLVWLSAQCAAGKRMIVIDPITAKDPSERPWVDDHRFMARAKDMLKPTGSSLILVTHPPKGAGRDMDWGDDVAGGAAYLRFAQTVLFLRGLQEEKEVIVSTLHGSVPAACNRSVEMRKTRNGSGWFQSIGYFFDPATLRHMERGMIP